MSENPTIRNKICKHTGHAFQYVPCAELTSICFQKVQIGTSEGKLLSRKVTNDSIAMESGCSETQDELYAEASNRASISVRKFNKSYLQDPVGDKHVVIEKFADSKITEMAHCITNVLESLSSRIPIGFLLREEENKFCVIQFNREISDVFYGMSHMEFYYGRVCSNKDKINRITAGFFERNVRIDIDLYALKEEEDDDKKYNKNLLTPKIFNESNNDSNKEYLTKLLLFLRKIQENIGSAGAELAADVDVNLFKSIERMSMLEADLIEYLR